MVALYNAMDGANWKYKKNWLSDAPISSWYGVTTNNYGRVTKLDLGENDHVADLGDTNIYGPIGLSGTIPTALGSLTELRVLDLSWNSLRGHIPSELGNLVNLEDLRLDNNDLSGAIPPELENLTRLRKMKLAGNSLSGCIPDGLRDVASYGTASSFYYNDLDSLGLPFCAASAPTTTPAPIGFTSSGSGTSSAPYIISNPTSVTAHSIRSYVSSLSRGQSVYFRWDVGGRPGSWTVRIDTTPTSHDFDLFGRDDQGNSWDDSDLSGDGDENITVSVQSGGHILIRVKNYDGGVPTDLTLTIEPPGGG